MFLQLSLYVRLLYSVHTSFLVEKPVFYKDVID